MRRRILSIIALFSATLLIISSIIFFRISSSSTAIESATLIEKRLDWVNNCLNDPIPTNTQTGVEFPVTVAGRLGCSVSVYGTADSMSGIMAKMDALIDRSKSDNAIRAACHDIMHNLGYVAWERFKGEGLVTKYNTCGMGYIHGLFSAALIGEDSRIDRLDELSIFCEFLAKEGYKEGFDIGLNSHCAHGIGHALGSVIKKLDEGYDICRSTKFLNSDGDPLICFMGVLNQFFVVNRLGADDITSSLDYCSTFTGLWRSNCAGHIYYNHPATPIKGLNSLCPSIADQEYRDGCWQAVGLILAHKDLFIDGGGEGFELLGKPKEFATVIEDLCKGDVTTGCIDYAVQNIGELALDTDALLKLCEAFSDSTFAAVCSRNIDGLRKSQTL